MKDNTEGSESLTTKSMKGFFWLLSGAGAQAGLKFLVLAVLARLLSPTEFGVVSAALIVVALAELFTQIGVAPAVVQASDLPQKKIHTATNLTIIAGLVSGAALYFSAGLIAALFEIAAVEQVVQAFSVIFLINGVAVVPEALLQRKMRFRELALVTLVSYLLGYALVGISLGYLGFGIWALVWANISQQLVKSVLFVTLEPKAMGLALDWTSVKQLFRFGAGVTLSRFGNYTALHIDYFIVGRWLGAEALGIYSRSYILVVQPAQLLGSAAEKVLFPALSSLQQEKERVLRAYYRATAIIAMTNFPATVVLATLAPEIIYLVLGSQWDLAVAPFRILVYALVFRTAYKLTGTVLRAQGSVYLLALWQWIYAGLVLLGAGVGAQWGLNGTATGVSVAIFVAFWLGVLFTSYAAQTEIKIIFGILMRYLSVALVLYYILYLVRMQCIAMGFNAFSVTLIVSAVAGVFMLAVWFFVPKVFGEEGEWLRSRIAPKLGKIYQKLPFDA